RFPATEADAAVEANGGVILGGDLKNGFSQPSAAEAVQRLQQESPAKPAAAEAGHHAEILNRAHARSLTQPLHSAAITALVAQEPGGFGNKPAAAANLRHQVSATLAVAEAGKHGGVNFLLKGGELHFRM